MRNRSVSWLCGAALAASVSLGVASEGPGSALAQAAANVVTPHVYVSLEPVPRGREFQVAVVAKIASDYHTNSHKPTDAYLIPTTLTATLPPGFELMDTIYPSGHLEKFVFSPDKPLDVYSGSVTLRLRVQEKDDAALGATTIPMTLRYQACNQTTCLPPVKLPVEAKFIAAAAGTSARDVHPEIFAELRPLR